MICGLAVDHLKDNIILGGIILKYLWTFSKKNQKVELLIFPCEKWFQDPIGYKPCADICSPSPSWNKYLKSHKYPSSVGCLGELGNVMTAWHVGAEAFWHGWSVGKTWIDLPGDRFSNSRGAKREREQFSENNKFTSSIDRSLLVPKKNGRMITLI